jgi:DNA-binding CsgD family transcriptional regulator
MPSTSDQGLRFIERCSGLPPAAAADDFLATIRQMGFTAGACGAWAGIGKNRRHRFFFVNWPADWVEFYNKGGWFQHDILPIEARRRIAPYLWSELVKSSKLTAAQKALYDAGWAYGWRDVFAVPIHGPGSLQGLVTIATREMLPWTQEDRALLEIMARTIWEHCRTAEAFGSFDPGRIKLSPREIECLQWAAAGKSDTDIAALIGIKPATAHFHIEQAKKRLGVRSRVEAVAFGVLQGII